MTGIEKSNYAFLFNNDFLKIIFNYLSRNINYNFFLKADTISIVVNLIITILNFII